MDSCMLQDWITINAKENIVSLPQSAHRYVDLGHHEDLVFYLDVRQVTGTPSMAYDTAPTEQDSLFLAMIAPITLAVGLRVDRVMFSTAAVPPARYVRWRLISNGIACNVTFRIWLAAYKFSSVRRTA